MDKLSKKNNEYKVGKTNESIKTLIDIFLIRTLNCRNGTTFKIVSFLLLKNFHIDLRNPPLFMDILTRLSPNNGFFMVGAVLSDLTVHTFDNNSLIFAF